MWKIISWMHPSYRDLIIDELASDGDLRTKFLENMSIQGIKLAISDTGGREGERRLPLMTDSNTWDLLRSRCLQISMDPARDNDADLLIVLTSAAQAAQGPDEVRQLKSTLQMVCDSLRDKWNSGECIANGTAFRSYCLASEVLRPLPPLPNFEPAWRAACDELESDLCDAREHGSLDPYVLESWTDLLKVIRDNEPRFLRQTGFPERFTNQIRELLELVDAEVSCEAEDTTCDELRSVSHQFERFKNSFEILESFGEISGDHLRIMLARLASAKRELDDRANELEGPDYDYDDYDSRNPSNEFDIDDLFSDL